MAGLVSVHVADIGTVAAVRLLALPPNPGRVPGLRHADVGLTAPLSASVLPRPTIGRAGLVAFWDDEAALDAFVADHPIAAALAGGRHARLEPLRVHGDWPGLDEGLARGRRVQLDGPAVVLTLGRLRPTQAIRFLKASAKAEGAVLSAPGMQWATGLAKPPFVATCSVWESGESLAAYAYGPHQMAHAGAIDADVAQPFHRRSAFIRFRPLTVTGGLDGGNPVPAGVPREGNSPKASWPGGSRGVLTDMPDQEPPPSI